MGPAVCVQAKVSARFEGSELAVPSRVTDAPEATAWSGPASAVGAAGGGGGGGGGGGTAAAASILLARTLPSAWTVPLISTTCPTARLQSVAPRSPRSLL